MQDIKQNAPKYATHYEDDGDEVMYYAKDTMGRWCYIEDDSGCGWPTHSNDFDRLDIEAKPL